MTTEVKMATPIAVNNGKNDSRKEDPPPR
jgi:hypothetical protein